MNTLQIAMVGDVFSDRADPPSIFRHIRPVLTAAPVRLGNLEMPLANGGRPERAKPIPWANFKSAPHNVSAIKGLFSAVGFASNHTLDWGEEAMLETLEVLEREGIPYSGSGRSLEAAQRHVVVESGGQRIAVIGCSCLFMPGRDATAERGGLHGIRIRTHYEPPARVVEQPSTPPIVRTSIDKSEVQRLERIIQRARAEADLVVISVHWGVSEKFRRVVEYQRDLGRIFVDAGADVVFGHHPHVIQGVEVYKGKPIAYSLGNFAFDLDLKEFFDFDGLIAWAEVQDGKVTGFSVLPVVINENNEPMPCNADQAAEILGRVRAMSAEYGTKFSEATVAGQPALRVGLS